MSAVVMRSADALFANRNQPSRQNGITCPPAAPAVLTDAQCTEISALISETNSDFAALMAWVSGAIGQKVTALKQIPAKAYNPIITQLKKKKESK